MHLCRGTRVSTAGVVRFARTCAVRFVTPRHIRSFAVVALSPKCRPNAELRTPSTALGPQIIPQQFRGRPLCVTTVDCQPQEIALPEPLILNGVLVADTFAEAFPVVGTRLVITAATAELAMTAATEVSGYASSVIACDAEADIERQLTPEETPDGRPGVTVLVFGFNANGLEKAVAGRVGQCVLTCATTACFNGVPAEAASGRIQVGGQIRYFGDGFQISKKLGSQRFWRIPVMDGEFLCEDHFGTFKGVGGGNLLIAGATRDAALTATLKAVGAMRALGDIALPFPGGFVRSGSKVGSRYPALKASTNDKWCPTLRSQTKTELPDDAAAVYEIVIDGIDFNAVQEAMRTGLHRVTESDGIVLVSAGNYGGKLGKHHFHLRDLID